MKNKDYTSRNEVYSATRLTDLVSSPVFFSIVILSLLLGFASAFGFLQNPRKLKIVVDVISQKLLPTPYEKKSRLVRQNGQRLMLNKEAPELINKDLIQLKSGATISFIDSSRYSIFTRPKSGQATIIEAPNTTKTITQQRYDIHSKNLWGDINIIQIQSNSAESNQYNRLPLKTGAILDSRLSRPYQLTKPSYL